MLRRKFKNFCDFFSIGVYSYITKNDKAQKRISFKIIFGFSITRCFVKKKV
nr:MAG TPA: hypothetical protein [Caudoviricetes sp.]